MNNNNNNNNNNNIYLEIAYGNATKQNLISISTKINLSIKNILQNSGITLPHGYANYSYGIWGKKFNLDTMIDQDLLNKFNNNIRIEIYHKLKCDPKEARKKRALN